MKTMHDDQKKQLKLLRKVAMKVASFETACDVNYKKRKSPLAGHCGCVSWLVRKLYDGDIVTGRVKGVRHYWNRLPNGQEVDLTSCQFGGDGFNPLIKGRKVNRGKTSGLTNIRYLLFYEKMLNTMRKRK